MDKPNRWILTERDIDIRKNHLARGGHTFQGKFKLGTVRGIFLSPQFWAVVLVDVLFWNAGIYRSTGAFLLWIKSLARYTTPEVNRFGTIQAALAIPYTLFTCFASDLFMGLAWAITFEHLECVPEGAIWFAFSSAYWSNPISSVFHGWVNNLLRNSPDERGFTSVMINIIAQSSTAWTQLLTFPTVEQPRYPKGYSFCLACAVTLIVSTWVLDWYIKHNGCSRVMDMSAK
ncbi:MFS transporter (Seo1) [Parahypoxylon ruwenzoriense]